MKKIFILTAAALFSFAAHAETITGDATAGEALHTQYQCSSCHQSKMGGDGSALYTRDNRRINNAASLLKQVKRCSGAIKKQLTEQEVQDISAYLNQTYYRFN